MRLGAVVFSPSDWNGAAAEEHPASAARIGLLPAAERAGCDFARRAAVECAKADMRRVVRARGNAAAVVAAALAGCAVCDIPPDRSGLVRFLLLAMSGYVAGYVPESAAPAVEPAAESGPESAALPAELVPEPVVEPAAELGAEPVGRESRRLDAAGERGNE